MDISVYNSCNIKRYLILGTIWLLDHILRHNAHNALNLSIILRIGHIRLMCPMRRIIDRLSVIIIELKMYNQFYLVSLHAQV